MTSNYKHFATLQFADIKKADHGPVYAVSFNVLDPKYYSLLAAVVNNRVCHYIE